MTMEDGQQLGVEKDSEVNYKYVSAGSVTVSGTNVACEGSSFKLDDGQKHNNIVQLISVDFKLMRVEIIQERGKLQTKEGGLRASCALLFQGCSLADAMYVTSVEPINFCPYQEVRRMHMQVFSQQEWHLMVNVEHKVLLEVGPKEDLPETCPLQGKCSPQTSTGSLLCARRLLEQGYQSWTQGKWT